MNLAVCTVCSHGLTVTWLSRGNRRITLPLSNRHSAPGLSSRWVSMTRPASARRRLVPPTLRDEPSDSACAEIAARGRGIGPTYPTRRLSAGSAAPTRRGRGLPGRRQFKVADDLWLFRSVAVAKAARATRRSSSPPELGPNRRTCHPHAEKDRRHPRLAPAGRVHSRAQHQGRGREAPALGTKARGRVRIRRGGGASWLAAALRRYVQARVCRSAPCRPRTAAVVAADGAAGVPCAFASWVRLARS